MIDFINDYYVVLWIPILIIILTVLSTIQWHRKERKLEKKLLEDAFLILEQLVTLQERPLLEEVEVTAIDLELEIAGKALDALGDKTNHHRNRYSNLESDQWGSVNLVGSGLNMAKSIWHSRKTDLEAMKAKASNYSEEQEVS